MGGDPAEWFEYSLFTERAVSPNGSEKQQISLASPLASPDQHAGADHHGLRQPLICRRLSSYRATCDLAWASSDVVVGVVVVVTVVVVMLGCFCQGCALGGKAFVFSVLCIAVAVVVTTWTVVLPVAVQVLLAVRAEPGKQTSSFELVARPHADAVDVPMLTEGGRERGYARRKAQPVLTRGRVPIEEPYRPRSSSRPTEGRAFEL